MILTHLIIGNCSAFSLVFIFTCWAKLRLVFKKYFNQSEDFKYYLSNENWEITFWKLAFVSILKSFVCEAGTTHFIPRFLLFLFRFCTIVRPSIDKYDPKLRSRNRILKYDVEISSLDTILKYDPKMRSLSTILNFILRRDPKYYPKIRSSIRSSHKIL